jgi:hypothetical protein
MVYTIPGAHEAYNSMGKDDHTAHPVTRLRINEAESPTPDISPMSTCLTQEEIYSYIRR